MTRQRQPARVRRGRQAPPQRRWPLVAGVAVALGVAASVAVLAFGGGHDSPAGEDGQGVAAVTTRGANSQAGEPSLSKRAGGLSEGAVIAPANAPVPPAAELRASGGERFSLPLRAHAGVEDYFGTPRLYGQVHGGVDFSLAGLAEIPVFSACAGTVASVGESPTLGTHVVVDCGDGWNFVAGFLAQTTVGAGDGASPTTEIGKGTPGGHLHVELRYQDVAVDPAGYMDLPRRVILPTPTPTPTVRPTSTETRVASTGAGSAGAATATATPRPNQLTATPTATPTITNTPTITPTPTWTPTPTRTPRPAAPTPTPLPRLQ